MKPIHVLSGAVIAAVGLSWGRPLPAQAAGPGKPSTPQQVVLSTMHQVNRLEMMLGQLARQKGASVDVRRYGDRLFRDHRFADGKVTALARQEGVALLPPQELPAAPELAGMMRNAAQLKTMAGPAFDRMFLQMMVRSNEMAITLLHRALTQLPAGRVSQLVSRLLPILGQHLELARDLQAGAAGSPPRGGEAR